MIFKEINILILLMLCFTSCKKQIEDSVLVYYPSKKLFNDNEVINFKMDSSTLNFYQLRDSIINLNSQNKIAYFQFHNKDTLRKVLLFDLGYGFIQERDILTISQIPKLSDQDNTIHTLAENINKQLSRNEDKRADSNIFVNIDLKNDESASNLDGLLNNLVLAFDKINRLHGESLELFVYFSREVPPPLPPPNFHN